VTHHTASLITAKARARSVARTLGRRPVASFMAVTDQSSALPSDARSPEFSRFHVTRQRAEQNLACSRRGANSWPHCSQVLVSSTKSCYA
jgi:hypothetical protein